MNSFDKNIELQKGKLNQKDIYPLTCKRSFDLYSERNNNSNIISEINNKSSFLFPNKSSTNKRHCKFSYSGNPTTIENISKTNLEYDIQLTALKRKLFTIKEQRKQSEMKVNLMKIRINKLKEEEKVSIRDLENIKKSIKKIQNIRQKIEKNNSNKTFSKKTHKSHNIIKNKTLSFINNIQSGSFLDNSNIFDKKSKITSNNSFHISMKKNKNLKNNFHNDYTPKSNCFKNKKGNVMNNSNKNQSKINYETYSFNNNSNNLDKINISNNKNNVINKNRVIQNFNPNQNKKQYHKVDLKTQIKQNLINKLKKDEEEKKRIQEEIRKIEKEQYNLWMNFSENMNSGNTTSNTNINSNYKINEKKDFFNNEEDDDNIVNYNYI